MLHRESRMDHRLCRQQTRRCPDLLSVIWDYMTWPWASAEPPRPIPTKKNAIAIDISLIKVVRGVTSNPIWLFAEATGTRCPMNTVDIDETTTQIRLR